MNDPFPHIVTMSPKLVKRLGLPVCLRDEQGKFKPCPVEGPTLIVRASGEEWHYWPIDPKVTNL